MKAEQCASEGWQAAVLERATALGAHTLNGEGGGQTEALPPFSPLHGSHPRKPRPRRTKRRPKGTRQGRYRREWIRIETLELRCLGSDPIS